MNMRRTFALLCALAFAATGLTGCRVAVHDSYYDPPPRRAVYVEEVHYHDDHCGHAWDGSTWIVVGGGHRHHEGCGHYWYGSRWCVTGPRVVVEERPRPVVVERHVCHDGCGHYWDGGRWVVVQRHVHGPGCGHVIVNGYWTLSIR